MPEHGLDILTAEISAIRPWRAAGRVVALRRGVIEVAGLSDAASLGDLVTLSDTQGQSHVGEVIGIADARTTVLTDASGSGFGTGARVWLDGASEIAPHDGWLGRVIDPLGRAMDGRPLMRGPVARRVDAAPPPPALRRGLGRRMESGLSVFNTLLPIVRGQRIGLFAGSGVGKSTLLARLALGLEADVVVLALVGERGRELREFTDRVLGPAGMRRSVVVAATSDQSPMLRRRCAAAAMAVAEHFRDAGRQVLYVADSITRLAEAHREVALAAGEQPSLSGYPPSVAPLVTRLCERAGPGSGGSGDITAVFSVLVQGSDMEGPVADLLRGVLDGHVVLDRQIAERGRFPAIDLLRSVSRSLPEAASASENDLIAEARARLGRYERAELMLRAGLYAKGSDPDLDVAIASWPALDAFIAAPEPGNTKQSFQRLSEALARPDTAVKPNGKTPETSLKEGMRTRGAEIDGGGEQGVP